MTKTNNFKNETINNVAIQEFENAELGFKVRCVKNEDGSISMNAEDTAIGFGWNREKNGKQYVMWDRINGFCLELGFPHKCGKDDFIPETLFYLLGMKASNETARKFQMWLATEVIPSIRKHGAFIADSENVDEDFIRNELRFSQKRTIKTFANAKPEEFKSLYEEFRDYVDSEYKYQTAKRVARYKSVEKGLKQWLGGCKKSCVYSENFFPDMNQICKKLLSDSVIFMLSNFLYSNSITSSYGYIHLFSFFCIPIRHQ